MWCTHCRKSNHDDQDCWSTRQVPPPGVDSPRSPQLTPPYLLKPLTDALPSQPQPCSVLGIDAGRLAGAQRDHRAGPMPLDEITKTRYLYVRADGDNLNDGLAFTAQRAFKTPTTALYRAGPLLAQGWSVTVCLQPPALLSPGIEIPTGVPGQLAIVALENP